MKLNQGGFSLKTVIIDFWDKPYQEINFKILLNSGLRCKWGKILSDFHMPCLVSFHVSCLWSLWQWNWKISIIKPIEIF